MGPLALPSLLPEEGEWTVRYIQAVEQYPLGSVVHKVQWARRGDR